MPLFSNVYITKRSIEQLKAYKYVGSLSSYLDRVIMTPIWNKSLEFVPLWVAPNLLTAISLLHAIATFVLICGYSPTMTETGPSWVYFVSTYNMFLYQLLDAIDGKQARRTGSSSPLGQLFDHGCDAICAFLTGLFLVSTLQCGSSIFALVVFFIPVIPFYMSNWEESNTGLMRFGILGVTEGQFLIMAILLATGIFGPHIWLINTPIYGLQSRHLLALTASIGSVYQTVTSIWSVYHYCGANKKSLYNAFFPLIQFAIYVLLSLVWTLCPYTHTYEKHPYLLIFTIGALFSYQISRLIIFHVTDEPYAYFFKILLPLPLVILNEYLPAFGMKPVVDPFYAASFYCAYTCFLYAHFVYFAVSQICSGLNISCFTIKPKISS